METSALIQTIDEEIERLKKVRALLAGENGFRYAARPKRRPLSAAARKRIADAQKRRWAAQKKAAAAK